VNLPEFCFLRTKTLRVFSHVRLKIDAPALGARQSFLWPPSTPPEFLDDFALGKPADFCRILRE
jgi:hypothetical protein